ncbi:hypothetical protein [Campylobacter hyointestinalis]|uniref:Uncharacterized protein n=1 Tax=Campylobacter hyointestinalis subsp. hyointestinalis TaxID=91352 RepID=A0A9W5AN32_CAMHY|nr:hypothetical protein [Campylobacter hyointestinalis]TWO21606.1 hypothetical protein YZ80_05690 [Campylobacter hyointestinalis]CUU73799.1 Uncharacterised protein [Campylobacter hyointestinalis subsp. hyointestinalis]CUU81664.1 Uncharacterised protein [Campylobacter hyointestinalis subsp. hyointestinalis]
MIIQQQYSISYEVIKGFVKATSSGSMKNDSGEVIEYGPSVRIFATNIYQATTENEKTGFANSYDRQLCFKINCETDTKAGQIANLIQTSLISNSPIYINGDIPIRKNDGSFEVSVIEIKGLDKELEKLKEVKK